MTTQTTAPKFSITDVNTADKTSAMIIAARGTQKKANFQYHMACLGASYQVLISGNRNQIAELLASLGKKSQRYQKIMECLRVLTGDMLAITEDKGELKFEYTFNAETKTALLGDTDADNWTVENTEFFKLAQKPWYDYELAIEDYGFDAEKAQKSIGSSVKKAILGGLTVDSILATVEEAAQDALKEKREKDAEDARKAQTIIANSSDVEFINAYANSLELPSDNTEMVGERDLVMSSFAAGDITKVIALSRLATLEASAKVELERIAEAATQADDTEETAPVETDVAA